jgi:hypothetical protein
MFLRASVLSKSNLYLSSGECSATTDHCFPSLVSDVFKYSNGQFG